MSSKDLYTHVIKPSDTQTPSICIYKEQRSSAADTRQTKTYPGDRPSSFPLVPPSTTRLPLPLLVSHCLVLERGRHIRMSVCHHSCEDFQEHRCSLALCLFVWKLALPEGHTGSHQHHCSSAGGGMCASKKSDPKTMIHSCRLNPAAVQC